MRQSVRCLFNGVLLLTLSAADAGSAQSLPQKLNLPAGSTVKLVVTRPVWAGTAKAGDPLYLQTTDPTFVGKTVAIPAGSYVLARLEKVTRPTQKLKQAVLLVDLRKIIFADGYTVVLKDADAQSESVVTVRVTTANDLLLDNGTAVTMTLGGALSLSTVQVGKAILLSKQPALNSFHTATRCVPDPGTPDTPATPDTVIPGIPPTPGTPDIVIPNGDGPPTVIPGTPGTPGTSPTVIPGSPGSPGTPPTYCPAPPVVTSSVLVTLAETTPTTQQKSSSQQNAQ